MAPTPKQIRLTLNQKVTVLKKLNEGIRANRLAKDFGVSESAISQIKNKRSEILAAVSSTCHEVKKKTLRQPEYPEVEQKLFEWFQKQRERNCPMNGPILKAKAKDIFTKLFPEKAENKFTTSEGWFNNFKRRRGIRFLKICGEILSSDSTTVTQFVHHFRNKITEMELTNAQIYNADESALYYRLLPDRTYVASCEKTAPGRKIQKERITFLLCSNADGSHKTKPMVIGKAKNPRCFKNFNNPLIYNNSSNAWMTSNIFQDWFHNTFVNEVRLQQIPIINMHTARCSCNLSRRKLIFITSALGASFFC